MKLHVFALDREPITWNPLFLDENGKMLGFRPWLSWGKLATSPTATFKEWILFSSKPQSEKQVVLASYRGGSHMYHQAQNCIDQFDINSEVEGCIRGGWNGDTH